MNKSSAVWDAWVEKSTLEMTLRLAPSDLQQLMATDWAKAPTQDDSKDADPNHAVFAVVQHGFKVLNDGKSCGFQALSVRKQHDMIIRARWLCEAPLDRLDVSGNLLARLPADHQHRFRFRVEGRQQPVQTWTRTHHRFHHRFVVQEPATPSPATSNTKTMSSASSHPDAPNQEETEGMGDGWKALLFFLGILLTVYGVRALWKRRP